MPLSDIVTVEITTEPPPLTQTGFGIPLFLSAHQKYTDRYRAYRTLTELVADGFASTDLEYKGLSAIFSQQPHPERVGLGRLALRPTMRWSIVPTAANSQKYPVVIGGTEYSFTSDSSGTLAEIIAALVTAINLGTGTHGLTASNVGPDTSLRLTAVQGAWQDVYIPDAYRGFLSLTQDMADPGVATDLDAIKAFNSEWYFILNPYQSSAIIVAIAGWAEDATRLKLFIAGSQDEDIVSTAAPGSDVAGTLKTAGRARTAVLHHPRNGQFADCAWVGKRAPETPGSETWAFASLSGPSAVAITTSQQTNIEGKNGNYYYDLGGRSVIGRTGKVAAGEYIDVVRGRDWLQIRMQERIASAIAAAKKIPFTDFGVAIIENAVRAQLREAVDSGFLAASPAPTVSVPKVANVSAANRALRYLPDVMFDAILAGAIHSTKIAGRVSVAA